MTRPYRTIDADGYAMDSLHLWVNYIDPAFRDQAPRFISNYAGSQSILIEDTIRHFAKGYAGATCFEKPPIERDPKGLQGGFDAQLRIPELDLERIDAAFLHPHTDGSPGAPNLSRSLGPPPDVERRVLAEGPIRFYNLGDPETLLSPITPVSTSQYAREGTLT